MGKIIDQKIIILLTLFAVIGIAVHRHVDERILTKKRTLAESLKDINGYALVRTSPLSDEIQETLELDDYFFADYANENGAINLYIGYYFSAAKLSAAHSPLVCLPSQGWGLGEPVMAQMTVGDTVIQYAQMEATLQGDTDLVFYWYQATGLTSPYVFRSKLNTFYNKFRQNSEQHAFVRITVGMADINKEEASGRAQDFIKEFYPVFVEYIGEKNSVVVP